MNGQLVFATVGTDHHGFDRLVDWLDDVAAARRGRVRVVVQHGHTRPPVHAEGHEFVGYDGLSHLMEAADVVVCHGGPGTIMDAHRAGQVPLVVPRDPAYGEHVDAHQLRFAAKIAATGRVQVLRDRADFMRAVEHRLDRLEAPHRRGAPRLPAPREASGVAEVGAELDRLLAHEPAPRRASVSRFLRQLGG